MLIQKGIYTIATLAFFGIEREIAIGIKNLSTFSNVLIPGSRIDKFCFVKVLFLSGLWEHE